MKNYYEVQKRNLKVKETWERSHRANPSKSGTEIWVTRKAVAIAAAKMARQRFANLQYRVVLLPRTVTPKEPFAPFKRVSKIICQWPALKLE